MVFWGRRFKGEYCTRVPRLRGVRKRRHLLSLEKSKDCSGRPEGEEQLPLGSAQGRRSLLDHVDGRGIRGLSGTSLHTYSRDDGQETGNTEGGKGPVYRKEASYTNSMSDRPSSAGKPGITVGYWRGSMGVLTRLRELRLLKTSAASWQKSGGSCRGNTGGWRGGGEWSVRRQKSLGKGVRAVFGGGPVNQ